MKFRLFKTTFGWKRKLVISRQEKRQLNTLLTNSGYTTNYIQLHLNHIHLMYVYSQNDSVTNWYFQKTSFNQMKSRQEQVLTEVATDIDFNLLLNKYGPEGLYIIADKLKEVADQNVQIALK